MGFKVYDNRELSWLKFNERVLEEAKDNSAPLMERLFFASIFSSNLDEFYMVRVGSLHDEMLMNDSNRDGKTQMKPSEQLSAVYKRTASLISDFGKTVDELENELAQNNITHVTFKDLSKKETEFLFAYFTYEIKPFVSPLVIDKRHPFPFLKNKEIYVLAKLSAKNSVKLGIISVNGIGTRVIFLPTTDDSIRYLLLEEILLHYAGDIFKKYKLDEKTLMRVTRNADIDTEEAQYDYELDFRSLMSELIKKRKRLCPVRLELSREVSELTSGEMASRLELSKKQVFYNKAPLDMSYVFTLFDKAASRKNLFFHKLIPQKAAGISDSIPMLEQIDKKDIFLSYPFESIKPFIRLLEEAAVDETVVSIKITLYRVAKNSKIVDALIKAAENGKSVLALVELRARFDEENNIGWSKRLEDSGCQILYGPEKLKVHSKLLLITRKIDGNVKYTTQIGTGNYNEKTATLYTDMCLMTADERIAYDACAVFNALVTGTLVESCQHLLVAPLCLQNRVIAMMDEQIQLVREGKEGYVGAKLNSLTDKIIIDKLVECSQAGVKVELVVRGISCLIGGVSGVTDNIRIVSIVGRYLEHSRIYIFGKGDNSKVYISSADYMTRNTIKRIEVAAPVYDEDIKRRILDMFQTLLNDNVKARVLMPGGKYERILTEGTPLNSQEYFFKQAYEAAEKKTIVQTETVAEVKPRKKGLFARLIAWFKK